MPLNRVCRLVHLVPVLPHARLSPADLRRHEHDERRGKAVTEAGMMKDIEVLKQLNFNAVRCSHYPNCVRWCALAMRGMRCPQVQPEGQPCCSMQASASASCLPHLRTLLPL